MDDIVEAALMTENETNDREDPVDDAFGLPVHILIGYGTTGVALARQEWDLRSQNSKDPTTEKHLVETSDGLDADWHDADIAVLVGTHEDRHLAERIGETLPPDTTTIALSILNSEDTRHEISVIPTVGSTIPYNLTGCRENASMDADTQSGPGSGAIADFGHRRVRELATDLMLMLTGEVTMSAPPGLYQTVETGGLTLGFRGRYQSEVDTGPGEVAETLVADTLARPFHTGPIGEAETSLSVLSGGPGLTLREAESIRAAVGKQTDTDPRLFTADTTPEMEHRYRLTVLLPEVL